MTEIMPRAVIYTRVSTEEQVSNFSLNSQEEECRKYAVKQGFEVVKVFREEGASAKTVNGRPTLLELLKFCQIKKNRVDKVLVYKLDRWSRNVEEGLQITSLLARFNVNLISITEPTENKVTV